jgi:hypothetical protein
MYAKPVGQSLVTLNAKGGVKGPCGINATSARMMSIYGPRSQASPEPGLQAESGLMRIQCRLGDIPLEPLRTQLDHSRLRPCPSFLCTGARSIRRVSETPTAIRENSRVKAAMYSRIT